MLLLVVTICKISINNLVNISISEAQNSVKNFLIDRNRINSKFVNFILTIMVKIYMINID